MEGFVQTQINLYKSEISWLSLFKVTKIILVDFHEPILCVGDQQDVLAAEVEHNNAAVNVWDTNVGKNNKRNLQPVSRLEGN